MSTIYQWPRGSRALPPAPGVTEQWPVTFGEWQETYNRRDDRYNGLGYTDQEIQRWHLFKALDESENLLAQTQQLTRDLQHVVDIGAATLAAGAVLQDGLINDPELTAEGKAIWRRSQLGDGLGLATHALTRLGRIGIEAMLDEDGAPVLVVHEPQHYRVSYNRSRTAITRVAITIPYYDETTITATGEALASDTLHTYVRLLYPDRVETYIDGKIEPEMSGEHRLGLIPFVNCVFQPAGFTQHGLHAAHALDRPIALYDSVFTQLKAVTNRMGNPLLAMIGARLPSAGGNVQKFGRMVDGIPAGGDLKYVESSLSQLRVVLDAADRARINARETLPEFLFAGAGAQASGDALRLRATAFERKYTGVRDRLFSQLSRITQLAHCYGEDVACDLSVPYYRIEGAPLLPTDLAGSLTALETTTRIQPLKPVDYVRQYQRLGLVDPSVDPDEYAAESGDTAADAARQFFTQTAPAAADTES